MNVLEPQRIYEIGISHGGNPDAIKAIMRIVHQYDPDGWVKLQHFVPKSLVTPTAGFPGRPSQIKTLTGMGLSRDDLLPLAKQSSLGFGVSVFSSEDAQFISEQLINHVDFFKVASPDIVDDCMLETYLRNRDGQPLLVSTGGASTKEIEHAARVMNQRRGDRNDCPDALLFCLAKYPAHVTDFDLSFYGVVQAVAMAYGLAIGFSDHSGKGPDQFKVCEELTKRGAMYVEKHIELPMGHPLYFADNADSPTSIEATRSDINKFVQTTSCRRLVPEHLRDRANVVAYTRRYWTATTEIKKGDQMRPGVNIALLRGNNKSHHGVGLIPAKYTLWAGIKSPHDISAHTTLLAEWF